MPRNLMSNPGSRGGDGFIPVTRRRLDELAQQVRALTEAFHSGTGGLGVPRPSPFDILVAGPWLCEVVDQTGGEATYSDERYWITSQGCSNAAGTHDADMTFTDVTGQHAIHGTATNLSEVGVDPASHIIPTGQKVLVWRVTDQQEPPVPHFVFYMETGPCLPWSNADPEPVSDGAAPGSIESIPHEDHVHAGVPSVNAIQDDVLIAGTGAADVSTADQIITINVDATTLAGEAVTGITVDGVTKQGVIEINTTDPLADAWNGSIVELTWDPQSEVNMGGQVVGNVANPVDNDHATNKGWVVANTVASITVDAVTKTGALTINALDPLSDVWNGATLELGWSPQSEVDMNAQIVGNVANPVDNDHAVNKGWLFDQLSDTAALDIASAGASGNDDDFARDDHVHRGVFSFAESGGAAKYGAVTISEGTNITINVVGNDHEIVCDAIEMITATGEGQIIHSEAGPQWTLLNESAGILKSGNPPSWLASTGPGYVLVGDGSDSWQNGGAPVDGGLWKHVTATGMTCWQGGAGGIMFFNGSNAADAIAAPAAGAAAYVLTGTINGGGVTYGWTKMLGGDQGYWGVAP